MLASQPIHRAREHRELIEDPQAGHEELAGLYIKHGVDPAALG